VILVFAILTGYLTIRSTSLYGPGLSPDSTGYIRLARDIQSNELQFLSENQAVSQPPLYPIVLAVTASLGDIPIQDAARLINVLSSAGLAALILAGVSQVTLSLPVLIIIGLLSSFSVPLTLIWSMAWTEPLFIFLLSIILLIAAGGRRPILSASFAGLLTAAACFTRYAGIVLIPVLSAYFFFTQPGHLWKRLRGVAVYAVIPTLLFSLYVLRNYAVSGTPLGSRSPSVMAFAQNVDLVTQVVFSWFLPWRISAFETLLLIAFGVLGAMVWSRRKHIVGVLRDSPNIVLLSATFSAAYTVFIVWTSTTTAYDHINSRLLAPIYPSLLIIFAVILRPESWHSRSARGVALFSVCVFLVYPPVSGSYQKVNDKVKQGAGGYNSRDWQESPLIAYFRHSHSQKGQTIYSNAPDALYILANVTAEISPARTYYHSHQGTGVNAEHLFNKYPGLNGASLVWFDHKSRDYLFTPHDLKAMCDLKVVRRFPDGAIYKVSRNEAASHD
jgi:hypothetical protein